MEKTVLKPGRLLKDRIITEYCDRLKDSSFVFVTDFTSVSNKDLEELKKKLIKASSGYFVIKDSLGKIALEKSNIGNMSQFISGTCGLSFGTCDPVSISKILVDFAKKKKEFILRGGLVQGEVIDEKAIIYLATLPSKEVLLTRLLLSMNAPLSNFVSICAGLIRKPLYLINNLIKKRE